ncbi:MAG TPA: lyase family protein, partial [Bacillota bacterium]|nr:lyase family protein [Bacillota bacterium]
VGKRATLWAYDLVLDLQEIEHRLNTIPMRGIKGTTGTQASFMELFENNESKIKALDEYICSSFGFASSVPVSGQTYTRKLDYLIMSALSGLAQSAYKFSNDMRILQSFEEMEEPFGKSQIGSSAMPYKRNPMRSERISSLARYIIADTINPAVTAGTQWFERTLDDSANRRIAVSEAFLAADAILEIYLNIASGMVVYPKVIEKRLNEKLPYMATENIMMDAVRNGANRQELHEKIRVYSQETAYAVRMLGEPNNLIERISSDPAFMLTHDEASASLNPSLYIGRCISQVDEFINDVAKPLTDTVKEINNGFQLKV